MLEDEEKTVGDFPGGPVVKNPPANVVMIPGLEDFTFCGTTKPGHHNYGSPSA